MTGPGKPLGKPLALTAVAARLGVSTKSVRRMLKLGAFPHAFRATMSDRSVWRVPETDVEAHLRKRRCPQLATSG